MSQTITLIKDKILSPMTYTKKTNPINLIENPDARKEDTALAVLF